MELNSSTSTSSQQFSADLIKSTKDTLQRLHNKRDNLRLEGEAIISELETSPNTIDNVPPMGIDTPLVDSEGYPRNDIDVYRARTLRNRLSHIRTDYKSISLQIETQLHQLAALQKSTHNINIRQEEQARKATKPKPKYDTLTGKWVVQNWDGSVAGIEGGENRNFEQLQEASDKQMNSSIQAIQKSTQQMDINSDNTTNTQVEQQQQNQPPVSLSPPSTSLLPFCRISMVESGSPADQAGLKEDDQVIRWSDVCYSTTNDASTLLPLVAQSVKQAADKNESVTVWIKRKSNSNSNDRVIEMLLVKPRQWQDRGLLGCRIVPC